MKKDIGMYLAKSPQASQPDTMNGEYKGVVVDVRDPFCLGRARVWSYLLHGDLAKLDVATLPWAEINPTSRGAFSPLELWDRVVISFEASDRYTPIIKGYYNAIPMGTGSLPHSAQTGSNIRPEGWNHNDLYPESRILGASGAGNVLATQDILMGSSFFLGSIHLEDTGGKLIRTKSYHSNYSGYIQNQTATTGQGALQGANLSAPSPARDGVSSADAVAGMIEISHQSVSRSLIQTTDGAGLDYLEADDIDQRAVDGKIFRLGQGSGAISMQADVISFLGTVMGTSNLVPPRKWD